MTQKFIHNVDAFNVNKVYNGLIWLMFNIFTGMPPSYYSFMWCFSPVIGVLIGPILGSASDRCTSPFGRRRPFIVGLVSGAIVGLTLLIFSKDIGKS